MRTKTKSKSTKAATWVKRKPVIAREPKQVKTVVTETKVTETVPVENEQTPVEHEPEVIVSEQYRPEIETPPAATPIETLSSSSMLDDLNAETDKDNEPGNEDFDNEDFESESESEYSDNPSTSSTNTTSSKEPGIGDKIHETLSSEGGDWQNPGDWKKMCAVNAMMYVEGGAIFLSFLGQLISGDWSTEGEKKYMPSEDRRKLIRNPLAAKLALSKQRKQSSPTGAMWTAIIFTILPIIIIAFKDRKAKIKGEQNEIELKALKDELEKSKQIISGLQFNPQPAMNHNIQTNNVKAPKTANSYLDTRTEKRGRHKKDCPCDKCVITRMKKKTKSKA